MRRLAPSRTQLQLGEPAARFVERVAPKRDPAIRTQLDRIIEEEDELAGLSSLMDHNRSMRPGALQSRLRSFYERPPQAKAPLLADEPDLAVVSAHQSEVQEVAGPGAITTLSRRDLALLQVNVDGAVAMAVSQERVLRVDGRGSATTILRRSLFSRVVNPLQARRGALSNPALSARTELGRMLRTQFSPSPAYSLGELGETRRTWMDDVPSVDAFRRPQITREAGSLFNLQGTWMNGVLSVDGFLSPRTTGPRFNPEAILNAYRALNELPALTAPASEAAVAVAGDEPLPGDGLEASDNEKEFILNSDDERLPSDVEDQLLTTPSEYGTASESDSESDDERLGVAVAPAPQPQIRENAGAGAEETSSDGEAVVAQATISTERTPSPELHGAELEAANAQFEGLGQLFGVPPEPEAAPAPQPAIQASPARVEAPRALDPAVRAKTDALLRARDEAVKAREARKAKAQSPGSVEDPQAAAERAQQARAAREAQRQQMRRKIQAALDAGQR